MAQKSVQHIGDDQLVYGLPKRMAGTSSQNNSKQKESTQSIDLDDLDGEDYWTVHPGGGLPVLGPGAMRVFGSFLVHPCRAI
ncbi:MAG: hypothetical protein JEY79_18210, partial [Pseudodesulfovibrio sp.]|nr:hypothetical protein [Pseudodesulfovibrio sp.]